MHSIWAWIQALINMLAIKTGGHKMSEQSHLMILTTALKSINPAFKAQFNALTNNMATEAVLKALNHVKASHHASPSSNTILYAGQGQHHRRPAFQHRQAPYGAHTQTLPNSLPPQHPTGPCLPCQQRRDNWGSDRGCWCSLHNSSSHSLEECHKAATHGLTSATPQATPQTTHTTTLAAMTTDLYLRMHFIRPLPNKTSTTIHAALQAIAALFPPAVHIHWVHLNNTHKLYTLMGAWILDIGAKREPTPPYTSEYNSVIEQFNHEVMTHIQCLLFNTRLPSEWWAEAACYACDVINLTPTWANLDSASPYLLWNGVALPSRHICVFGAPGWMHLHTHEWHKISEQSMPVRFMSMVDYSLSTYQVYIIGQHCIVDTCNIVFNEHCITSSR
jgi:transposase InsO family protein